MPADQFLAHELNARRHPGQQREALRGSLNAVGWIAPVIVSKRTGKLLDGHARIEEALTKDEAGLVPFVSVDVDEGEEALILGTFDPITNQATYDREALDGLLRQIETSESGLQQLLSDLAAREGLYLTEDGGAPGEPADAEPQIDRAAELNEKWKVGSGDLWLIGEHRLLCGDSTKAEDVARVMGGEKADMVFADPPYGIAIVATNGFVGGGEVNKIPFGGVKNETPAQRTKRLGSANRAKPFGGKDIRGSDGASNVIPVGRYAPIIGDETTDTAVASYELCALMFPAAAHVWWGGNYYANALPPSSCWIVWDKENTGNFADAELAWTNQETAVRIFKHQWNGMIKESERGQRRVHPTQKPVALAVWCFEQYGEKAGVVFDPFGGSGMSMVAAENKDKKARLIEMSPNYCAVILERMATAFPSLEIRQGK